MTDVDKLIELQALITEREAMVEENEARERQGYAHAWPASCFTELAEAMRALKTVEAKPEQQPTQAIRQPEKAPASACARERCTYKR